MKYRKKPIVVEAIIFEDDSVETITKLQELGLDPVRVDYRSYAAHGSYWLNIETLEGTMRADVGDHIIKGVDGEFYPCKPDIFEKTYEIIQEETE